MSMNRNEFKNLFYEWNRLLCENNSSGNLNEKIREILNKIELEFPDFVVKIKEGKYDEIIFEIYASKSDLTSSYPVGAIGQLEIIDEGYLEGDKYKVFNVSLSLVEENARGYGPLLYELALEYISKIPNAYFTSDRESVTDKAKGVWNYYFKNREDVEVKQFDITGDNSIKYGMEHLTKNDLTDDLEQTAAIEDQNKNWFESSLSKGYRKNNNQALTIYLENSGRLFK